MKGAVGWKISDSCFSRTAESAAPVRQSVVAPSPTSVRPQSVPGSTVPGVTASSAVAGRASTKAPSVTVTWVRPKNSVTRPLAMVTWSPIAGGE